MKMGSLNKHYEVTPNIRVDVPSLLEEKSSLLTSVEIQLKEVISKRQIEKEQLISFIKVLNKLKLNKPYKLTSLYRSTILYRLFTLIEELKIDNNLTRKEIETFISNIKQFEFTQSIDKPLTSKLNHSQYPQSQNIRTSPTEPESHIYDFSNMLNNIKTLYFNKDLNSKSIKKSISILISPLGFEKTTFNLPLILDKFVVLLKLYINQDKISIEQIQNIIGELDIISRSPQKPETQNIPQTGVITIKTKL